MGHFSWGCLKFHRRHQAVYTLWLVEISVWTQCDFVFSIPIMYPYKELYDRKPGARPGRGTHTKKDLLTL